MNGKIKEVCAVFLRLGVTAFGGPVAHIAMMKQEVVNRRQWMGEQEFLDLVGATNLIPGPNSTELAIHIGKERAGWKGLVAAGACFILPAVFITLIFAWLYKKYGLLPQVQPFIYGIKPAIIAIVLSAMFPLAKKALKSKALAVLGLACVCMAFAGLPELYILFGSGAAAMLWERISRKKAGRNMESILPVLFFQVPVKTAVALSNLNLFLVFLKIGAILYGSGYVLFSFLDAELVQTGLMPRETLIDAIAVGQFTPGPVFSAVTFVGYQINSWRGAAAATAGVFLPSFAFVALLNPLLRYLRGSGTFSAFIDAVNVASVALILVVCYTMAIESVFDWRTIFIGAVCAYATFKDKPINSAAVIVAASAMGYLLTLV